MSKSLLIIPAVLLVVLLATAGAVFAYDDARPQVIAEGITIDGIDVGGMTPAAARARVERELVDGFERPVRVHHDKRTWTLGPKEARIATDVDEVVATAFARSEEGGVLGRSYRRLASETVEADLRPTVTFSEAAVERLVDRIRRNVGRRPKDAQMSISPAGIETRPGRRGLEVKAEKLRDAITASLGSPTAERRFVAETRKITPKVTRAKLMAANPVVLIANRSTFQLKVYKRLALARTYGIAVGRAGNDTPAGEYTIANKAVNPAWTVPDSDWAGDLRGKVIPGGTPENPLKARWLGITDGVGIHGTSERGSIGSNASHGCLRMLEEDVIDLYPQVPVGARILIA